jgi:hypothetical protein
LYRTAWFCTYQWKSPVEFPKSFEGATKHMTL